jgi:CheY-like chemotaxis protein
VDDEPSSVELLRRMLERNGYATQVAHDGEAGLEQARSARPDLILLDVSLPRLDGWSVLDRLVADPATQAIPVVVVSVDDRKRISLEKGASDHLVKPVQGAELDAVLKLYARRHTGRILLVEDDEATARLYERGCGRPALAWHARWMRARPGAAGRGRLCVDRQRSGDAGRRWFQPAGHAGRAKNKPPGLIRACW